MTTKFTHVDNQGKAEMVDVSTKPLSKRLARASGLIYLAPTTIQLIQENQMKKGDVLSVAKIAGIQAAKQTANLIPLCHPLLLDKIDLTFSINADSIQIESLVKCTGPTGVEMEALTAVATALLTIYDMCKAVDKHMIISEIKLLEKTKANV